MGNWNLGAQLPAPASTQSVSTRALEAGGGSWALPVLGPGCIFDFFCESDEAICGWRGCWSRLGCLLTIPLCNFPQIFRAYRAKPFKLWCKRWSNHWLLKQCFFTSNCTIGVMCWDSHTYRHSAAFRLHPSTYHDDHMTMFCHSLISGCYSIIKSR